MTGHCGRCGKELSRVVDNSANTGKYGSGDLQDMNTCAFLVCEDCVETHSDMCESVDVCTVEYGDCDCSDC